MKRTSFARSPFSMNGRYRLQIVSFGAQQLLCEKELVMRVNQTTVCIIHDPWPANGTTQPGKDTPVVTSGQKLTRSYEWICNGRTVSSSEGRDTGIWEGFVVVNTSYSTSTILPAYDW